MPLCSFDALYQEADARRTPVAVAVAGGADRTVLEAVRSAQDRRWITARVCGGEDEIRRVAHGCGVDISGFAIISAEDAAVAAVAEVRAGRAQLVMKGRIATPALMRAMLDPERGLRTERVICQIVLMELRATRRRFLLADTGICIQPTVEQKLDILRSTLAVARSLGADRPRVAVMAATESVTPAMPETVEAAELQRRAEAGEFGDCSVQGPLSFDLAMEHAAADKKGISGDVAGAADILLFPN